MAIRQGNKLLAPDQIQIQPLQHIHNRAFGCRLEQIILGINLITFGSKLIAMGAKDQFNILIGAADLLGNLHSGDAAHKNIQYDHIILACLPMIQKRAAAMEGIDQVRGVGNYILQLRIQQFFYI